MPTKGDKNKADLEKLEQYQSKNLETERNSLGNQAEIPFVSL